MNELKEIFKDKNYSEWPVIYVSGNLTANKCSHVVFYGDITATQNLDNLDGCVILSTKEIDNSHWYRCSYLSVLENIKRKEIIKLLKLSCWGESKNLYFKNIID